MFSLQCKKLHFDSKADILLLSETPNKTVPTQRIFLYGDIAVQFMSTNLGKLLYTKLFNGEQEDSLAGFSLNL